MDLQNKGLIRLGEAELPADGERTLIVSGVARSGTSMVARVLGAAGVFMGEQIDDVVFEDREVAGLFEGDALDRGRLEALRRRRDAAHLVWGFKRPQLHRQGPAVIELFRAPSVIVTVRDPVAVAERYAIAEQLDIGYSLSMAMADLQQLMQFVEGLDCPVLLVSYEKALCRPDRFVASLLDFCGLSASAAEQARLAELVEPDRPTYIEGARRCYEGYVDGIQGTMLAGWAYQRGYGAPLGLSVFCDGVPVAGCLADRFRADLQGSGIGDGRHGFAIDLAGLGFTGDSSVTVRIRDRSFALTNSGATAAALGADVQALGARAQMHPWRLLIDGVA